MADPQSHIILGKYNLLLNKILQIFTQSFTLLKLTLTKLTLPNIKLLVFFTVNGNWGNWEVWGSCSLTCGSGSQSRTRLCNNPAPSNGGAVCVGSASESQLCNTATCPVTPGAKIGLLVFLFVCLSLCLSICPFVHLSVCLSICPFVCLSNPTYLNTTYQF